MVGIGIIEGLLQIYDDNQDQKSLAAIRQILYPEKDHDFINHNTRVSLLTDVANGFDALSRRGEYLTIANFDSGHLYIPKLRIKYELRQISSDKLTQSAVLKGTLAHLKEHGYMGRTISEDDSIFRFTKHIGGKTEDKRIFVWGPYKASEEWTFITRPSGGGSSHYIRKEYAQGGESLSGYHPINSREYTAFNMLLSAINFPREVFKVAGTWNKFLENQKGLSLIPTQGEIFEICNKKGHLIYPEGISKWIERIGELAINGERSQLPPDSAR